MANQHKMQKVLPFLLQLEKDENDYFPEAVSFGPYHHGEPKLAFVEAFKPKAVKLLVAGGVGEKKKAYYYEKVVGIIGDIRNCYEPASTGNYSDADLAEMMLRDASLIIIYMKIVASDAQSADAQTVKMVSSMKRHLGMLTLEMLSRDLNLLENQIPLLVIKLLVDLRYEAGESKEFIDRFFYMDYFGEHRKEGQCKLEQRKEEPLHLLEATHWLLAPNDAPETGGTDRDPETGAVPALRTNTNSGLISRLHNIFDCKKSASEPETYLKKSPPTYRAAIDLKAKGIYLRPSPTRSLKNVDFKPHLFKAWLEIPEWTVSTRTKVFFKNMVAYELSPGYPASGEILSYINFMNSLIEKPEDVKELRESKILYNMLGSDKQVLKIFQDINTHGAENVSLFNHVRDQIREHSDSRIKTSIAELIHTHFQSPWTATGFLAAVALLGITIAQLYYAVHPPRN